MDRSFAGPVALSRLIRLGKGFLQLHPSFWSKLSATMVQALAISPTALVEQENASVITVGAATKEIAKGDGQRTTLLVANSGTNPATIAPDPQVSSTRGIVLPGPGGPLVLTTSSYGNLPRLTWLAVSPLGTTLYVFTLRGVYGQDRFPIVGGTGANVGAGGGPVNAPNIA